MAIDVRPRVRLSRARWMRTSVLRVDGRGGLVEHEQVGVGEVGPGEGDELPLPRRHRLAALPDVGGQTLRQRRQPRVEAELGQGEQHVVLGGLGRAEADVVEQRGVEEEPLLRHEDHAAAQRPEPDGAQVDAVDGHRRRTWGP